jgi:hypothetical protein
MLRAVSKHTSIGALTVVVISIRGIATLSKAIIKQAP